MAEGWILKKKIVRSHKFRELYNNSFTQLVYCLLISAKDSWGMMPADPATLRAELGPFDTKHTAEDYSAAIGRLVDVRLVYKWNIQGDPWIYVIGHDEEHSIPKRSKRPVVPRPDLEIMEKWGNVVKTDNPGSIKINPGSIKINPRLIHNNLGLDMVWVKVLELELEGEKVCKKTFPLLNSHAKESSLAGSGADVSVLPPLADGSPASGTFVSPTSPSDNPFPGSAVAGGSHPSTAHVRDNRPVGHEHAAILELQSLYSMLWDQPSPTAIPTGDNLQRVLLAIRNPRFGGDGARMQLCYAALYGHRALATKEGSQLGRNFRSAFPPARTANRTDSRKLDEDRFDEFVVAGRKLLPNPEAAQKKTKSDKARSTREANETAILAKRAGVQPGDSPKTMLAKFTRKQERPP